MASSRYGGAGELLAWRPDHVGHEAHMGTTQGVAPGLWQGVQRARTMRILTRFANRRLEDYAKMAL